MSGWNVFQRYILATFGGGISLIICCCSMTPPFSKNSSSNDLSAWVPEEATFSLARLLREMPKRGFDYPWNGLESYMADQPDRRIALIGYGSLLNPDSAARTISDTPLEGHPPVLAMGGRRLFNYVIPASALGRYPKTGAPRESAALNIEYSCSEHDLFNGRLIEVTLGDLEGLRKREYGYDLRPVAYVPWNNMKSAPKRAYVLVAEKACVGGRKVIDNTLLPQPGYAEICRKGAALVSPEFLTVYLKTTWLGDGARTLWGVENGDEQRVGEK